MKSGSNRLINCVADQIVMLDLTKLRSWEKHPKLFCLNFMMIIEYNYVYYVLLCITMYYDVLLVLNFCNLSSHSLPLAIQKINQ